MPRSPDDRDIRIQPRPGATPPSTPSSWPTAVSTPQSSPARPLSSSAASAGRRWLVLIAIDRYAHPEFLPSLKSCVADAEALRTILCARYGFSPQHTIEIYNEEATERAIRRAFEGRFLDLIASDDDVVIAFSGHGYYDPRSQLGRWYAHDAEEVSDGILNSAVRDWCKALPARHVLVVSDSCFAGSLLIRAQAVGDPTLRSRELIASGGLHPVADSGSPDGCHSVFNYYLCRGLERLAERNQPFGTNQLYVMLYDPIRTNAEQEPQHGIIHGAQHEGGQFLFLPRRVAELDDAHVPPPRLLDVPDFVTDDIEEIERHRRERESQRREAEEQSLREFVAAAEKAYQALASKDDSPYIDASLKVSKWREFLDAFGGKDDEVDRRLMEQFQKARERVAHWEVEIEAEARRNEEQEAKRKAEDEARAAWKVLVAKEPGHVETKAEAEAWRAAWDDYLSRHAVTGINVDEARQRRDRWADWMPVTSTLTPGRPETGFVWRVDLGGGVTMNLVYIRGGTFLMGSPDSEAERFSDEGPQTRVTLTKDFWLGETQVTQAQYQAVMGTNPSHFKGDNLPVENVSCNNAMEFCKKLTEKGSAGVSPATRGQDGRAPLRFMLPTEAQWEYACRAGTTTRYSFGDSGSSLGDYAWFDENSGGKTQPVKTKKPNAWGLYDIHGNVLEWCSDWYSDELPGGSVTDPLGASLGFHRVNRGGSWFSHAWDCRSANRGRDGPGNRGSVLGFRVLAAAVE